jgi:hypothetical protein
METSYSADSTESDRQTIEAMPAFPTPPDTVLTPIASPISFRFEHKHHESINSTHSIGTLHDIITDTLSASP